MNIFSDRQGWKNLYRAFKYLNNAARILLLLCLLAILAITTVFTNQFSTATISITISISVAIALIGCFFMGVFGALLQFINLWKKRVVNDDKAIREIAIGIEYQLEMMGLEPVNKIELKKKGPSLKS